MQKLIKQLLLSSLTLSLFLSISCLGLYSEMDYDRDFNFNETKTFKFTDFTSDQQDLIYQEARRRVIFHLEEKGWEYNPDKPFIEVDFEIKNDTVYNQDTGIGLMGGGGNGAFGMGAAANIPLETVKLHHLVFMNILSEKKQTLIWQAQGEAKTSIHIKNAKKMIVLDKIIQKILKDFPPEKK